MAKYFLIWTKALCSGLFVLIDNSIASLFCQKKAIRILGKKNYRNTCRKNFKNMGVLTFAKSRNFWDNSGLSSKKLTFTGKLHSKCAFCVCSTMWKRLGATVMRLVARTGNDTTLLATGDINHWRPWPSSDCCGTVPRLRETETGCSEAVVRT